LTTLSEMDDLHERSSMAEVMAFQAYAQGQTFKYGSATVENAMLELVSHDYNKLNNFDLYEGRYFTEAESAGGYPVTIIGYEVAKNLFPQTDPIDKTMVIRGRKVKVIGVFAKEGESIMGNSHDGIATVPINFARKFVDIKSDRVNPFIAVKAKEGVTNQELIDDLKSNMRSIRRLRPIEEDNFALNESRLLSNQIGNLFSAVSMAGWIIGGFSILVGGFGIANIMFVSVKERTPIIGIQKSLGAKNYFILIQFLTESVVLCLIGGLLGLVLVYFGTLIAEFYELEMPLTLANIILGLTVSALIGIISGFIPSFTASRLDPVEAIRSNG
jgi:putative ABC transport system permease protein